MQTLSDQIKYHDEVAYDNLANQAQWYIDTLRIQDVVQVKTLLNNYADIIETMKKTPTDEVVQNAITDCNSLVRSIEAELDVLKRVPPFLSHTNLRDYTWCNPKW